MGVVYRARDLRLERDVALKFLPPRLHADGAARDRLLQEARAASVLDHPNVASVYEVGEATDGRLFIAMACYRGETLKKRVARGAMDADEATEVAVQIADGLAHAHDAGIVHRDVKPANVMVTDTGRAVVVDFGIAQTHTEGPATATTSGTAAYMSPEQASGAPTDTRTDVWGLGATLHEMLTGRRAFEGAYAGALLYAVSHEPHASLAGVPAGLAAVVDRCLAKAPADRYPDAAAVAQALRALRGEHPPGLLPPTRRGRAVLWARRLSRPARLGLALAIVALSAVMGTVGWLTWKAFAPTGDQHLAVLPFRTLGEDPNAASIAAGLLETLTSQISQISPGEGSFWVIPASEVIAGLTPRQAREQLGATIVVDGTIQFENGAARVTFNLIDTATLRQIASGRVDQSGRGALALQDQAVLQLARLLRINVGTQDRQRLLAGGTSDTKANALYLRGRGQLSTAQTEPEVKAAADLFRQSIARDPAFALAHAALGDALWSLYGITDRVEFATDAVRHSEHALALDDGLAPVHVSLGKIYQGQQKLDLAMDSFERALDLDPANIEAARLRAIVLSDQGREAEAEAAYRAAIALRPGYWPTYNSLGVFYYNAGRNDEAVAAYRQGLELVPSNPQLLNSLGAAFWMMGRYDQATEVFERLRRVVPEHPYATVNLATIHFYLGDFAEAATLYADELTRHPEQFTTRSNLGDALWWSGGRRDQARAAYRQSIRDAWPHLSLARSPEVLGTLASAYAKLGVRDSALAYLNELRSNRRPEDTPAEDAFGIGEVYETLGDRAAARRWIQSALDRDVGQVTLENSPWLSDFRASLTNPEAP